MIKVLINGANGKMGRAIAEIIRENPSYGLEVCALRDSGVPEPACADCGLIIDFSLPAGAAEAFELAKQKRAAFLTGTTNLAQDFIKTLKEEKSIPVFFSPNVSIGVYEFTELLRVAAKRFEGYKISMHEIHHFQKKDAPSGTAKNLAAAANFPSENITCERTGTVPGRHSITLTSPSGDEKITLLHEAVDRKLFANSAVKIAAWVAKQKPGFYDMKNYVGSII